LKKGKYLRERRLKTTCSMMKKNCFEQYRKECEKCNEGKAVVIPANDPKNGEPGDGIDLMFVNERPGPTALKTGFISPENPDESARRFTRLFGKVFGMDYRKKIFITNAVLWCPKVENYTNQTPTSLEVECGVGVLLDQINKIKPKVIVAMGRHALNALRFCFPESSAINLARKKKLKDIVGTLIVANPHRITLLFHTSPLNVRNRAEKDQLKDWENLKRIIEL